MWVGDHWCRPAGYWCPRCCRWVPTPACAHPWRIIPDPGPYYSNVTVSDASARANMMIHG